MDIKSFLSAHNIAFSENEDMSRHSTFKTGGTADFFVCAEDIEAVKSVAEFCKKIGVPLTLLGLGSNVLVSDKGIEGIVLTLNGINEISIKDNIISCGAGANLAAVCIAAATNALSGLEFAFGIPGSVGGAIFMNAGAYGGEIKDVIKNATVLTSEGEIKTIQKQEMQLGYRSSIFKKNGDIVLSADFELALGSEAEIKKKMNGFLARRKEKQPLEYPSAGSTFKRPDGYFAGALIEQAGLKGYRVGGAMVSEKHAGFVINYSSATAADIKRLIKDVQQRVFESSGVELKEEIIYIGRD